MNFLRLKTSLYRAFYKHFSKTKHRIVTFRGAEFVVRPDNYIDRRMWIEGGYEKAQIDFVLNAAKQEQFDAFLDIGANFGLYSCVIGASGLIPLTHSFECDPRNIYHLYGHLKINRLTSKTTVHTFAVGDEASEVKFCLAPEDSTGISYVGEHSDGLETIIIEQKPLDSFMDLNGQKLLLKIDVENHEEAVIKGAQKLLSDNDCLLQIEILDDDRARVIALLPDNYALVQTIGHDSYFKNF